MALIGLLLERIREAGAPSEEATERDGFLSYSGETHSVGYGFGIGAALALHLSGVPYIFELVLLSLGGVGAKRRFGNERVWREITDEVQYFIGALGFGFTITAILALLLGASLSIPV